MGRAFESITEPMQAFIEKQHMFFVATAPDAGRVNLSPKGYDSFAVINEHTVAYADITGSGAETVAHLRQNGRITIMFCAFEGKPNVVRLYGAGRSVQPGDERFDELRTVVGNPTGLRSVIIVDLERTSMSCGYSVPFMDFVGERPRLNEHWENKSDDDLTEYWDKRNAFSIDGLPAMTESDTPGTPSP